MLNYNAQNFSGPKTTSHSQSEGRLKVSTPDLKRKKKRILKKEIKKAKYG